MKNQLPALVTRRAAARFLAMLALLRPSAAAAATTKITFVLVNDIYRMGEHETAGGKIRGGFPRLASVVKAERARGGHVIFAHAGDTLSPSLMSGFDRGEHIIRLTNMVRPDVFVPGNHEYDFGKEVFLERMREARFPLFAANLRTADGRMLPGFRDRDILPFDGVRIGITGATADDSPRSSSPGDLAFAPTVETVKAQAAALRREGADFVLAVVHAPRSQDTELFGSRAADLILTGDDHDLFIDYDHRTAIVESSSDAHYVTAIDITLTVVEQEGRRRTLWWPDFRVIDTSTVAPDPEVAAVVRELEAQLAQDLDVELGATEVEIDARLATVRTQEAAAGNLIADAMRASTGAAAAVMNGGGIRLEKVLPAGSAITRRDVLSMLPFLNRLVLMRISGRDLRAGLENGLSAAPEPAGRFPQVSGLRIVADLKRPKGARILSITIGEEALMDDKTYTVATNDYLAHGGDGYVSFATARHLIRAYDGPLLANEVMVYVRRIGRVKSSVEGRIVLR